VSLDERTGADGEVVWSWRPDAGAKFSREAIPAKVTGAKEPGPRGERDISRKTIAQGMPVDAAYLWLLTRVLFFAHAAAGALRTRHSLRPLASRGWFAQHLGRYSRRGNAESRACSLFENLNPLLLELCFAGQGPP
jgi:hypothetical protein